MVFIIQKKINKKTGNKTKKLLTDFVKSQGGIVEFNDGEVIADWKRE